MDDKILFEKDSRTVKKFKTSTKIFFSFIHQENLPLTQQLGKRLMQK